MGVWMSEGLEIAIAAVYPGKNHPAPKCMSAGASGLDLFACLDSDLEIPPGRTGLVGIGYSMAIPRGYEGQVRPRSGLALRHQIGILNSPGTIDSDFRGEIRVILFNFGIEPYTVRDGDRIAQLVIQAVPQVELRVVDSLDQTERAEGGYGHTGR